MSTTTTGPSFGVQLRQIEFLTDLRTMADRLESLLMDAYNALVAAKAVAASRSSSPVFIDPDNEPSAPLMKTDELTDEVKQAIAYFAEQMHYVESFHVLQAAQAALELGHALSALEVKLEAEFAKRYEPDGEAA